MGGRDARYSDGGQRHRRRLSHRRGAGHGRRRPGHDRRHPWQHLWRQSAGHGRGQRGGGHAAGRRLPRSGERRGQLPAPATGTAGGRSSASVRGSARPGLAAGPEAEAAGRRLRQRGAGARPAHRGGGRECGAHPPAPECQRSGNTRGGGDARTGRRYAGKTEGCGTMNAPVRNMPKHFLDLSDHGTETLRAIIEDAKARKAARGLKRPKGMPDDDQPLQGRTLAMIFDKQSTRTRISFDMAARQLGGSTLMLTGGEMQLAREETIADTARVISRYVDAIMIRLLDHEMVEELALNASIPVINGLTKWSHPCQIMADVLTFEEHRGPIA